jgi:hypothetical protein
LASQWIPREQNKIADNLSRYSDCDDWGIHSDVFEELDALWGTHTVDRLATDYNSNSKCLRKGTEAINAFIQNSSYECNWLVPPPCMASKVIRKFCEDRANGTLVVPLWKTAPYWVLYCTNLTVDLSLLLKANII